MLPWSNVRGGLWRVNKANEVDESILSTGNSKCKEKKSKRETWFIWEQRDGLWVEHRKCKDNNKKQVAHFSSFPRPHCRVPPSVLACQPQGGTQDPVPSLWPLCHPKGVDFVSQDGSFHLFSHTLLPTEQQRQNMSDQVPSYYHRTTDATCLTLPFGLEIKNSCADACGSAVSSFR